MGLSTVKAICKRVDLTGSAVIRKTVSGRPRTVRTAENVKNIEELICSQENQPRTSRSRPARKIAEELTNDHSSIVCSTNCET